MARRPAPLEAVGEAVTRSSDAVAVAVTVTVAVGLVGVLATSRALRGFLYEVPPTDPVSLAGVGAAVGILAVVAALAPARRAAATDPMSTLRSE